MLSTRDWLELIVICVEPQQGGRYAVLSKRSETMVSPRRRLGRFNRAEDHRGVPKSMHPCARQGGTVVRVLRASARLEPTTSSCDSIHMGDAIPSCEPSASS